ncbi:type II secretion system F family protein [Promicromonospora sp. NPDC090134]|uniref:type II secretion system F family protein n=1 Tax=Promicromonospora sp. NPDC090134 TaxID=3364408 RepID=UPI00380149C2
MLRAVESLGVGLLVAVGAWLVLARGGRRLREVLAGSGVGVVPGPAASVAVASGAEAAGPVTTRSGRGGAGGRGAGGDVRVVVLQVVALLKAGSPPGAAWSRAVGVGVDLAGVPDVDALGRVLGSRHAEAVVAATRLALDVGAPLGRVLEQVAATLVAEAEAQAERDAALAGPRTTGRLLMWLPVAGGFLGWVLGADPVGTATDGGIGTAALVAGAVLLVAGRVWSGRLVATAGGAERSGVDVQVVLELLAAAMRSGAGVPRALQAVGAAVDGPDGQVLVRAAHALVLGAPWERAWPHTPMALGPVVHALRGAWLDGAAPSEALHAAGAEVRHVRSAASRTAAARLGVRLVLPLGVCYLPAFVLVGLVPVLLALGIDLLTG